MAGFGILIFLWKSSGLLGSQALSFHLRTNVDIRYFQNECILENYKTHLQVINNINYVYSMGTQVVLWYFIKVLYRMKVFSYSFFITMYFVSINVKYNIPIRPLMGKNL